MSEKKCSCGHTKKWHGFNINGEPYCQKDNCTGWNRCDIKSEEIRFNNLEFHIKCQDCFGTMATVLKLNLDLAEEIKNNSLCTLRPAHTLKSVIEKIIEDLMYLQRNYKIENK